jgi:DNA-binding transcriptional ArsR family regulator
VARDSADEHWLRDVDEIFDCLAHPTRRQILLTLHFWGGAMTAGEIAGRFEHTWPTVSRHLAELRDAGLVEAEAVGRERHYHLQRRFISVVEEWLGWFNARPSTGRATSPRPGWGAHPLRARGKVKARP